MSLPWMRSLEQRGPVVGSTAATTSKRKTHRDVIYPIFLQCAELESNAELKKVFQDLAHNILPKGFNVRNKTLAYTDSSSKATPIRMDLEAEALHSELIKVLSSKKGLRRLQGGDAGRAPSKTPTTWKQVQKLARKLYILTYLCEEGDRLGWSEEQIDLNRDMVELWLDTGQIRRNEVTMVDGRVLAVADLVITEEGVDLAPRVSKNKSCIRDVHLSRLYQAVSRPQPTKKEKGDIGDVSESISG